VALIGSFQSGNNRIARKEMLPAPVPLFDMRRDALDTIAIRQPFLLGRTVERHANPTAT
jgi:hypothetical protein